MSNIPTNDSFSESKNNTAAGYDSPVHTDSPRNTPVRTSLPKETKKETNQYAILQETNDEEGESWYYFIKWNGNEHNLKSLDRQLEEVEWDLTDNLSTFDLEIQVLVSEQTAKEMTKVDLNSHSFHRKFDGVLHPVNLGFKHRHSDAKKMLKAFNILGYGQIEDFIDEEDIDEEDLTDHSETESDASLPEDSTESDSDEKDSDEKTEIPRSRKDQRARGTLPPLANPNLPRAARAKRRSRR